MTLRNNDALRCSRHAARTSYLRYTFSILLLVQPIIPTSIASDPVQCWQNVCLSVWADARGPLIPARLKALLTACPAPFAVFHGQGRMFKTARLTSGEMGTRRSPVLPSTTTKLPLKDCLVMEWASLSLSPVSVSRHRNTLTGCGCPGWQSRRWSSWRESHRASRRGKRGTSMALMGLSRRCPRLTSQR